MYTLFSRILFPDMLHVMIDIAIAVYPKVALIWKLLITIPFFILDIAIAYRPVHLKVTH